MLMRTTKRIILKLWTDPVWSKIIAAIIIFTVPAYYWNLWASIVNYYTFVTSFLAGTTKITNWILILLILISALSVIIFIKLLVSSRLDWKNYTSDSFFGVSWHWKYSSDGSILNLYSCCSECDYQIFSKNISGYNSISKLVFHCDCCDSVTDIFDGEQYELESRVKRLIQKNIRTGQWKH